MRFASRAESEVHILFTSFTSWYIIPSSLISWLVISSPLHLIIVQYSIDSVRSSCRVTRCQYFLQRPQILRLFRKHVQLNTTASSLFFFLFAYFTATNLLHNLAHVSSNDCFVLSRRFGWGFPKANIRLSELVSPSFPPFHDAHRHILACYLLRPRRRC